MLQITKAWIYLFGGFYDLAEKLADEAFVTSQTKETFAPFSMGTICILAQIYIYLKRMNKFDVVVAQLKSQAEYSGLAQTMYDKLQDLATEQKKLWERYVLVARSREQSNDDLLVGMSLSPVCSSTTWHALCLVQWVCLVVA